MAAITSNLVSHRFSRHLESTDGSMDSNSNFGRESPLDNTSCCSDDTVLSVGKESPPSTGPLSFKNIESHLNAISQLNASLGEESMKNYCSSSNPNSPISTKSLDPYKSDLSESQSPLFRQNLTSSPESSPKPTSETVFFRQKPPESNNDSNGALKFSIDNILKADFGRRITDPLNIKKSRPKKGNFEEVKSQVPVDLTKQEAEKSSGSENSSGQPMLWPAWVYCTRYSDRPSSGKYYLFFFLVNQ